MLKKNILDSNGQIDLCSNFGGPLHYFGNRNLTLPDANGHMKIDPSWLRDSFDIIFGNRKGQCFERCFEPFAGSASWSFMAMELGFSKKYYINDGNSDLIEFFKLSKNNPNLIKTKYAALCLKFKQSKDPKVFFNQTIKDYNSGNSEIRSLILPFIVNHSWAGMVFYDDQFEIIYKEVNFQGKLIPGFIQTPSLSEEQFFREIDRISKLLNENDVYFQSGDFMDAIPCMNMNDFIILNPPYPENQRSVQEKVSLYVEMHSPSKLHTTLTDLVSQLEKNGITYFMSYGLHNPNMDDYLIRNSDYHLRLIGAEESIFGKALDRTYMNIGFSVPPHLKTKILPAFELLQGRILSHYDALQSFIQRQVCDVLV